MENEFLDGPLLKSFQQSKRQAKRLILSFEKCLQAKQDLKSTLYKLQIDQSKIKQANESLNKKSQVFSVQSCKIQDQFSKELSIHKETHANLMKLREIISQNHQKNQQITKYIEYLKSDELIMSSKLLPLRDVSSIQMQISSLTKKLQLSQRQLQERQSVRYNQQSYLHILNGMHQQSKSKIAETALILQREKSLNIEMQIQLQQKQKEQCALDKRQQGINVQIMRCSEDIHDGKDLHSLLEQKHLILQDKIKDLIQSAHKLHQLKEDCIRKKSIYQKKDNGIDCDWISIKIPINFSAQYAKHRLFKIKG